MFRSKARGINFKAVYDKFGPNSVVICTWPDGHTEIIRGLADLVGDKSRRSELIELAEKQRDARLTRNGSSVTR